METFIIQPTDDTPSVVLEPETGNFIIEGKSLPEDVSKVYDPLIDYLEGLKEMKEPINFNFKFKYFNTASSKKVLEVLYKLEEINEEHDNVTIKWHFWSDDDDMEDAGYEYADLVEVPFEMLDYE